MTFEVTDWYQDLVPYHSGQNIPRIIFTFGHRGILEDPEGSELFLGDGTLKVLPRFFFLAIWNAYKGLRFIPIMYFFCHIKQKTHIEACYKHLKIWCQEPISLEL